MGDIRLSAKHGINPSLEQCFVCGEAKGVVLFGRLPQDQEAPKQVCLDQEPCPKCKGYMAQGVILISVREPKDPEEHKNPYRTGGWCVVREDMIRRVFTGPAVEQVLRKRVAFMPDAAWDLIGLPREADKGGE